ncbi:MAG: sensor histidine kinase [Candidatus Brocadiales bacterium]
MAEKFRFKKPSLSFKPEKFNLLLYYTLTSFLVISAVSVGVGFLFAKLEKDALVRRSLNYFKYMTTNLNYAIYQEFFFPTMRLGQPIDLENNREQFNALDAVIRKHTFGQNVQKLYIFDTNGQIIYSTVPEHVGYTVERGKNDALDKAIQGGHGSRLLQPGITDDKGVRADATLMESYYPLYEYRENSLLTGKQVGVIEIYQDMSDLVVQIASARKKAIITTASTMGFLFVLLFLVVGQGARVINTRTRELKGARQNLEQKVEERTKEIKKTYSELRKAHASLVQSEKMVSLGRLVAGIAHEINNPLASIGGCTEGLLKRLERIKKTDGELKEFQEYLTIIYDETYRCKGIISKLLNFTREIKPAFESIELKGLISDVSSVIRRQVEAEGRRVKIGLNFAQEPLFTRADPHQLRQVFLNLFINSLDAIKEEGKITVTARSNDSEVIIFVQDTGSGIAPEHLGKVFDPFFTTKPVGKGTGLGLSICYGIIGANHGKIEAFSEGAGKGSIFKITLPLLKEHTDA